MRRAAAAGLALAALAAALLLPARPMHRTPLWPGARYSREDRDRAVQRGLAFIYNSIARNPANFADWGHDLLSAFYNIAETSADPELRRMAYVMGHERALEWKRLHPAVPADSDALAVSDLVYGLDAAERLGVPQPRLRAQLRLAAARFSAVDYYHFDPALGPPPADIPEACSVCGTQNPRGASVCRRCGARLKMRDPYDLLQDALIGTYTGGHAGIQLGAPYTDVLRWLPAMRPFPPKSAGWHTYYAGVYAATHIVYTYNDYSQYRVSPDCFPQEFAHLRNNLEEAVAEDDPETMGEYLDTLRAFGLGFENRLIRAGFDFVLGAQNPDGSWGDIKDTDVYGRYHPTWTAIDGIRDYRWGAVLPCPEVRLRAQAR